MTSSRKPASNVVLLLVSQSVVGRFEPRESDGGRLTPAARRADRFLKEVAADETHELYASLMAGEVEVMNVPKPQRARFETETKVETVLTIS